MTILVEAFSSVMEDIPSDPIYGSKTRSVSPARKLRSDPGFPHISFLEMFHARPALLTVFSTTQLDHSKTHGVCMPSRLWGCRPA